MKTDPLAKVAEAIDRKRAEAAQAYKTYEECRAKALEEDSDGNVRGMDKTSTEFQNLNTANGAYSALVDDVHDLEAQLQTLTGVSSLGKDTSSNPFDDMRRSAVDDHSGTQAGLDVAGFMAHFRSWREQVGAHVLSSPNNHFGAMPAIKFVERDAVNASLSRLSDIRATTVETASYPSVPFRRPGIVPALLENLDILDLITLIPTDAEVIQIVTEAAFVNGAVPTAEAATAPEGAEDFTLSSVSCQWIPFTIPQTRQILQDEPRLQSFIQNRILWGVRDALQNQFITGNGTGQNLTGILNWPGIQDQLKSVVSGALQPQLDAILQAKTDIIVATKGMYRPTVLCINPTDLETIMLIKDTLGRYIYNGPQSGDVTTIWGLTPVSHPLFPAGKPFIADMSAFEGYVREGVTVSMTDSNNDHFVRGIVDFLASGRFACAVTQPKAFCTISNWSA